MVQYVVFKIHGVTHEKLDVCLSPEGLNLLLQQQQQQLQQQQQQQQQQQLQ